MGRGFSATPQFKGQPEIRR